MDDDIEAGKSRKEKASKAHHLWSQSRLPYVLLRRCESCHDGIEKEAHMISRIIILHDYFIIQTP